MYIYVQVLVHCHLGVSRAPTCVLAYLLTRHGMTLDQAREQVGRQRCWDRCFYNELFFFTRCENIGWSNQMMDF